MDSECRAPRHVCVVVPSHFHTIKCWAVASKFSHTVVCIDQQRSADERFVFVILLHFSFRYLSDCHLFHSSAFLFPNFWIAFDLYTHTRACVHCTAILWEIKIRNAVAFHGIRFIISLFIFHFCWMSTLSSACKKSFSSSFFSKSKERNWNRRRYAYLYEWKTSQDCVARRREIIVNRIVA